MFNKFCLLLCLMLEVAYCSNPCISAVTKCCSSEPKSTPFRCFEINNCAGIIWGNKGGADICERVRKGIEVDLENGSPAVNEREPVNTIRVRTPVAEDEKEDLEDAETLSNCQRAIFNCCEEDIQKFPFRCFEINLCPTLFWGKLDHICSSDIVNSIAEKISRSKNKKTFR